MSSSFKSVFLSIFLLAIFILPMSAYAGWSAVGAPGVNDYVEGIVFDTAGNMYVGGNFTTAGSISANYVAKLSGSTWSTLGTGMDKTIIALAYYNNNLYACGFFTKAGGVTVNGIARWDGTKWNALGAGVDLSSGGAGYGAFAMAFDKSGNLYVGGVFTKIGGISANNIAKWNGSSWSALGSGVTGGVSALAFDSNGNLYVGGYITQAGGVAANNIVKYNPTANTWTALGSGFDSVVNALTVDSANTVYAGGNFINSGTLAVNYVAKWNGSWNALGTGMDKAVYTLALDKSGYLYAGGEFTTAGGAAAGKLAQWKNNQWNPITANMDGAVYELAIDSVNNIYAGGTFTTVSGVSANKIAKGTQSDSSPLPDTGITKCYNDTVEIPCPSPGQDFYGQDAQYVSTQPSYTKLDSNGNVLSDSATTWAMVKDNVTGLIWENKTTDGSIHDTGKTYTWDDAQNVFIAQLNASNFGGHNDWRMPTVGELRSIVDYSRYSSAIDIGYFPNTQKNFYWSSSATNYTWGVSFGYGYVSFYGKSNAYYVRAVRGGHSGASANLVINNDGTVTDTTTGLMWQQVTGNNGVKMTWKAALAYCENLSLAGYTDWRLPNIRELASLADLSRSPVIDPIFPDTKSDYYWSSSSDAYDTSYVWYVHFGYGYDLYPPLKSSSNYIRAVRGGQVQPATRIIALTDNLAFGDIATGQTAIQTLTISNTGNAPLTVTSITYPESFSGNWSGTIPAGGSQSVTVTFSPTAAQPYSGTVTVNSDKTSGTDTISISGKGVAKIISLSGNLAFGDVQVNSAKQSNLTISNIGNTKLTVSSITYPSAEFSGNWNSGTIMPGASQVVTVTFTPTAVQSYSGDIKVNSDKTSGTDTIAISGTGTIVPTRIINLSGSLAFGSVKVGSTATKTLTIRNTGNSTLTVNSITYPSAEFSGNWSGTIEPNVAQDVIVTFAPKAAKTYNSTVKVNSDKTSGTDTISISATVVGDDVPFVIRTLSSCYSPGTKMTVTLKATPPSGTLSYTISDSPPAGWTVSNISSPGSYDSANKKVKFIFFDGSAQTLTYDVLPPVSDTGDKSFAGNVLRASLSSAVTGMSDISQCQNQNNHPADVDADFRITGEELNAYIAAWQNGDLWNGVKITDGSYPSVAGGIWLNGETYKYDPNAGSPPLCWVNTSLRSVRDNGASSVVRKMSAVYKAGEAITVYLEVTVSGGLFYTIEETPPEGWTVSDISGNGHFDNVNKVVTFYGNQSKTWSYKVTPPAGTSGIKTFIGKSWFNGAEVAITGISSVSDTALSATHGDVNGSGGDPDLADAIIALQVVAGINPPNVNVGADVNGDKKIGLEEVVYILQKVAGLR